MSLPATRRDPIAHLLATLRLAAAPCALELSLMMR